MTSYDLRYAPTRPRRLYPFWYEFEIRTLLHIVSYLQDNKLVPYLLSLPVSCFRSSPISSDTIPTPIRKFPNTYQSSISINKPRTVYLVPQFEYQLCHSALPLLYFSVFALILFLCSDHAPPPSRCPPTIPNLCPSEILGQVLSEAMAQLTTLKPSPSPILPCAFSRPPLRSTSDLLRRVGYPG